MSFKSPNRNSELTTKTDTVSAVIVHQYDFLQEPSRRLVYDAVDGPFDDRKSFVQVDQHNADCRKILGVLFLSTPVRKKGLNKLQEWCEKASD